MLTNLVPVLPAVHVEAQDKVLHISSPLPSHELQMHWTCQCMAENNSKEEELYPPIWFSFWSPQTPKEGLPVKGEKKRKKKRSIGHLMIRKQVNKNRYECTWPLTFHAFLLPESSSSKYCPWLSKNQSTVFQQLCQVISALYFHKYVHSPYWHNFCVISFIHGSHRHQNCKCKLTFRAFSVLYLRTKLNF